VARSQGFRWAIILGAAEASWPQVELIDLTTSEKRRMEVASALDAVGAAIA
jgi:histidyl-tRNA synthetase